MEKRTLHIHVSNLSEDVWEFVNTLAPEKKEFEIRENAELSDRDLFCFTRERDLLLIMPKPIDPDFLQYYRDRFPKNFLEVWSPAEHHGELSLDILRDKKMMRKLDPLMDGYTEVSLTSYSSTYQFYTLLESIRQRHANVLTPETPRENWTTDFFGSKTGFRQASRDVKGIEMFPMCPGTIVFGTHTASAIAARMYENTQGVVIKTNKGHAGMGVVIIRKGELKSTPTKQEQIMERLSEDYWKAFPIVVEEFVSSNPKVGGGFPNAECFVDERGGIHYLYSCGMRVSTKGEFKGVEIGTDAMPVGVEKLLEKYGRNIGKIYAKNGYVGYFDVDCIYGKDKKLYVSESNVRRTGGTHVYLAVRELFGKEFMAKTYALSNNLYGIKDGKPRTFPVLVESLRPTLFDPKEKEGLFIVAANLLHRAVFGYIILGKTKERAYAIEKKMERLLGK